MTFTLEEADKIIDGVYSGTYTTRKLPEFYFDAFSGKFESLVEQGYGDGSKLKSLVGSTTLFSAAKTYQLVRELETVAAALGKRQAYQEAAEGIFLKFSEAWGSAEENTALQQAYQAQKWEEIVNDVDLFPNLRYSTIGDACAICLPLNGIVAPANDPIWKKIYPTNHYNCLCVVLQEKKTVRSWSRGRLDSVLREVEPKMSPVFLDNVGISGEIFNKKHPYYDVPVKDKKFAKGGFGLI